MRKLIPGHRCFRLFALALCATVFILPATSAGQSSTARPKHAPSLGAPDCLRKGKEFGSKHQWREAEESFRSCYLANPNSVDAVVLHAEALIQVELSFDAALELQEFLKEHPDAVRVLELHAVLAAGTLHDRLLAEGDLEKVVKLVPQKFQAWKSLGDLYMDELRSEYAARAYASASHLRPNDAVTSASLAFAYMQSGAHDKAAVEFNRALKLVSAGSANSSGPAVDTAIVQFLYGQFLLDQGHAEGAVVALSKALAINLRSPDAYYWRARAYEKLKDFDHAKKDALQAIRLAPGRKEAPLLLVTLYRNEGDRDKAQEYAEMVQKIGEQEQAEASFGRTLRDALDKAEPLLRQGRFEEATPQYEAIIKMLPTFYEAYFALGMCYGQTGRPGEAEARFRKYLSFQPLSADGHAALGILLLQQKKVQDATPELEKALQIDPSMDEIRKALASVYLGDGRPAEAVRVLNTAKKTTDADSIKLLATALLQDGKRAAALAEIKRLLVVHPDDPEALRLKQEINGTGPGK
jgi:tetratricopeptide (TPR) repeat protein